jgi:hypothetical protein
MGTERVGPLVGLERILRDKLVLDPGEIEGALHKALCRRFHAAVYYLQTTAPVGLETISPRDLAAELAAALTVTAKRFEPPLAGCVDHAVFEFARATLADMETVRRWQARKALGDLLEEAVKLRMLLGAEGEREAKA